MAQEFCSRSLTQIDREFSYLPTNIEIEGTKLTIPQIVAVARACSNVEFTRDKTVLKRMQTTYEKMMADVRNGIPIYGCNTGYGGRASHVLTKGNARERVATAKHISEGIVHVDVSVGPNFESDVVRAAMLIRMNMLMQGVSAVKLADLEVYRNILNANITPLVNQYGGIGASGDLAHNGRVLSVARQLKGAKVWDEKGVVTEAKDALSKANIAPLTLDPKAGLGLVNGDNFSTGLASLLAYDTLQLLLIHNVLGAMIVEAIRGTDRSFHPLLAAVRSHSGQREVAEIYAYLLKGSKLAYQEMAGHVKRPIGVKVQDGYSLRGISQYHGVNFEKIKQVLEVVTVNANSVSDNPLWVPEEFVTKDEEPWQWVSGGNFIAMHMVEAMDALRKTLTQIVKLNDRHLARLVTVYENNGLPANLSDDQAVTHCAFKGVQTQSGMLEVYSSLLSIPVSTFFGVHEEANQDITSHALTSGIFGLENLRLARYSTAQNLVAIAQAIDLRGGGKLLSPRTRPVYSFLRSKVSYVTKERPLNNDIEAIYQTIVDGSLMKLIRENVLQDLQESTAKEND